MANNTQNLPVVDANDEDLMDWNDVARCNLQPLPADADQAD